MRKVRRIGLAIAMAIAVATASVAASSASALEVIDEATGEHCGAVTFVGHGVGSGGCVLSATNEGRTELGTPLGMIDCDSSFQGRVGEEAEGFIYSINLFNCSPNSVDECKESGVADNWPVEVVAEAVMEAGFCTVAFGFLTINCHLPNINVDGISHTAAEASTAGHQACEAGGGNSIRGHWSMTFPAPGLELIE